MEIKGWLPPNEWLETLDAESRAKADKSIELLTRLGASDPAAWVASEMREDIPQVGRFLVLRRIRLEAMDPYSPLGLPAGIEIAKTLDPKQMDMEAEAAVARLTAAGGDAADILRIARSVAFNSVFGVLCALDGVFDDRQDAPDGPEWSLMETDTDGNLTGRCLDGLHESLLNVFATDEFLS